MRSKNWVKRNRFWKYLTENVASGDSLKQNRNQNRGIASRSGIFWIEVRLNRADLACVTYHINAISVSTWRNEDNEENTSNFEINWPNTLQAPVASAFIETRKRFTDPHYIRSTRMRETMQICRNVRVPHACPQLNARHTITAGNDYARDAVGNMMESNSSHVSRGEEMISLFPTIAIKPDWPRCVETRDS